MNPNSTSPANHKNSRNNNNPRPLIGITMGDPAGIGAEVIVKALADPEVRRAGRFIVFGLHEALEYAADMAEINPYWFRLPHEVVTRIESGVVLADFDEFDIFSSTIRSATAQGGEASMRFLNAAIKGAKDGFLEGIVTGPICQESGAKAGYRFPGHTEKLAHAFGADRVTMMFVADRLRVALASIHEPLFELRNKFTIGLVFQPIDLMGMALRMWFGIERPRIAVCGLNPHAGESGMFGDEERRIIEPAILMAQEAGWDAQGPYPADTVFWQAIHGKYDGVVAMYHDQGLIPVKLLAFDSACQTTLGLPIIRTSVDHGTAFDVVSQNAANPASMRSAIRLACQLAVLNRNRPAFAEQAEPEEADEEPLSTSTDSGDEGN